MRKNIYCAYVLHAQYKMNGVNNLLFDFDIEMDNKELQKMILEGDAEYVIHIECANTSYRTTIHDISNHVSKEIPIGRINGRIEIIVLIVTKKDVNHFVNSNWNDDYQGLSFELSKGSILAYKNIPAIDIVKNYEEFNSASSIFKVYKRLTTEPKPMEVELSTAQIGIGLGLEEYEIYEDMDVDGNDISEEENSEDSVEEEYIVIGQKVNVRIKETDEPKIILVNYLPNSTKIPPLAKSLLGCWIGDEVPFQGNGNRI